MMNLLRTQKGDLKMVFDLRKWLLSKLLFRPPTARIYIMKNSRRSSSAPTYQSLETRKLLAGDVTVSVDGSTLNVLGDGDANQVQIIGQADGSAVVTGLDGTTINGGTTAFSAAAGLNAAQVQLEGGDDELTILGLTLDNSLTVRTGDGNDSADIQNLNIRGIEVSGE